MVDRKTWRIGSAGRLAGVFLLATLYQGNSPGQSGVSIPSPLALGDGPKRGELFQVSTLDALAQGVYSASLNVGNLKARGDFGLGTYEGLDGEMIVVDGHYYHMRADGSLSEASDGEMVPFAAVTFFRPEVQFTVNQMSMEKLSSMLDSLLPSRNFFYAIRIDGVFSAATTRAIPLQFLPYLPLAQLIPTQSLFSYSESAGTAVDIRSPAYAAGINQVAHHYHYVSLDRKGGGHLLSFTTGQVTISIQTLRRFELWLPDDELFQKAALPFAP